MLKYRKTINGDYSFGNNSQDYISGNEAVALAIKSKILLFYNEWWEDRSIGIPMFQSILGQVKSDNLDIAINNLVSDRIKEIPQVKSIESIQSSLNNRKLTITIECIVENNEKIKIEVNI